MNDISEHILNGFGIFGGIILSGLASYGFWWFALLGLTKPAFLIILIFMGYLFILGIMICQEYITGQGVSY